MIIIMIIIINLVVLRVPLVLEIQVDLVTPTVQAILVLLAHPIDQTGQGFLQFLLVQVVLEDLQVPRVLVDHQPLHLPHLLECLADLLTLETQKILADL